MSFFDSIKSLFTTNTKSSDKVVGNYKITKPSLIGDATYIDQYTFRKAPCLFYVGNGALELDTVFTVANSQEDAEDRVDEQIFTTNISIGMPQLHHNFNPKNYQTFSVEGNPVITKRIEYDVDKKELYGKVIPAKHVVVYLAEIKGATKEILLNLYSNETEDIKQKAIEALELIASTLTVV